MKCPICVKEGKTSTITQNGATVSTYAMPAQYYDEDGNLHCHDTNKRASNYRCSNKHYFSAVTIKPSTCCDAVKGTEDVTELKGWR
jgi:hypothetical protein